MVLPVTTTLGVLASSPMAWTHPVPFSVVMVLSSTWRPELATVPLPVLIKRPYAPLPVLVTAEMALLLTVTLVLGSAVLPSPIYTPFVDRKPLTFLMALFVTVTLSGPPKR